MYKHDVGNVLVSDRSKRSSCELGDLIVSECDLNRSFYCRIRI